MTKNRRGVRRCQQGCRDQVQADAIEHYDNDFARVAKEVSERQTAGLPACRRFTRLTNAFSKKLENLAAAPALHLAHYNLVRIHRSLRITPAMAAGVTERVWELADLLAA